MHVIAMVATKGGSGKSTTAVNLADAALESEMRVMLVDLDDQPSSTHWGQFRELNRGPDPELKILPTSHAALDAVLADARRQDFDLVIVDTPGRTDRVMDAAVRVADLVLIPCQISIFDVMAIMNTVELCHRKAKSEVAFVVLTQTEKKQAKATANVRIELAGQGISVMVPTLDALKDFVHSLNTGDSAIGFNPKGDGAAQIRLLFQTVGKALKGAPERDRIRSEIQACVEEAKLLVAPKKRAPRAKKKAATSKQAGGVQ